MKQTAAELQQIIDECVPGLEQYAENDFALKSSPNKWSKQEILGHLIDSAHSNMRRFIVTQYESEPHVTYDQDFWVSINGYQNMEKDEVILLWKLLNEQICRVLNRTPESAYMKECNTGKTINEFHTLQFLAEDYVRHLKYHMHQILPDLYKDIQY